MTRIIKIVSWELRVEDEKKVDLVALDEAGNIYRPRYNDMHGVNGLTIEVSEIDNCAVCGWPLRGGLVDPSNGSMGCSRGDCSQRPFPEKFYDKARAEQEYGRKF
jgi:hypothetical protein